jgi:hypothetical protein
MDQLLPFLSALGPWGVLAGAVATIIVQRLRDRFAPKPAPGPVDPADPKDPTPAPVEPSKTPLLDAVLNLIRLKLLKKVAEKNGGFEAVAPIKPASADIDVEDAQDALNSI